MGHPQPRKFPRSSRPDQEFGQEAVEVSEADRCCPSATALPGVYGLDNVQAGEMVELVENGTRGHGRQHGDRQRRNVI